MKSKKPIILILICTLFTSIGQIFLKIGADKFELNMMSMISNMNLILGVFFYAVGLLFMISALKYGELSFLYPFIALSFVWVFLLSYFFLKENITYLKLTAVLLIILGVSFIGASRGKK